MVRFNTHIIPPWKGAFLVGGSIRDILARRVPGDYDFVVLDNPKGFAMAIGENTHGQVITLGKPGLTLYRVMSPLGVFDVTPAAGPTLVEDLSRRDFTINAMAVDLYTGDLIDPFGGRDDLEKKRIRMVSSRSFEADPIRLLRAYRMAALFDFDLEPDTRAAIGHHRLLIDRSAGERINAELLKIFERPHSAVYLRQMIDSGLLFVIFPELEGLSACPQNRHHDFDVLEHTLRAYEHLESMLNHLDDFIEKPHDERLRIRHHIALIKFAILLHDIGKPGCLTEKNGAIHFYGHEILGADMAEAICTRLKCSGYEKKYTAFVIRHHLRPLFLFSDTDPKTNRNKAKTRFFMTCGDHSPDILLHACADFLSKKNDPDRPEQTAFKQFVRDMIRDYFTAFVPVRRAKPVLTGRDLIREFSMTPSPFFRIILDQVEESRLAGQIRSRDEAVRLARDIIDAGNNHSSS
ncbi:HD domain-containing protein [Desulfatiferula olefinivorans]